MLIGLIFAVLLGGCFKSKKVNNVHVLILKNEEVQNNYYRIQLRVYNSNLKTYTVTTDELHALQTVFKEQAQLSCLSNEYIVSSDPIIERKVESTSHVFTYNVIYYMTGNIKCLK